MNIRKISYLFTFVSLITVSCKTAKVNAQVTSIKSFPKTEQLVPESDSNSNFNSNNPSTNRITHGPILGKPNANSMSVWARTNRPGKIQVRARAADGSGEVIVNEAETNLENDNTGVVNLEGLNPNTRYTYSINIKGEQGGPSGSFKTWMSPELTRNETYNPDGLFNFTFEFACGNSQGKALWDGDTIIQNTFTTLNRDHADGLDFAILNGDWLYERARTFSLDEWKAQNRVKEIPESLKPIPRIVGIWENYKSYLDRGKTMARFHRNVPSFFTIDDHEVLNDLAGSGEAGYKERRAVLRDLGAQAWMDYLAWSNPIEFEPSALFSFGSLKENSDILTDRSVDFTQLPLDQMSNLHVHWGGDQFSTRLKRKDEYPGLPNAGVYDIKEVISENELRISPSAVADSEAEAYSIGRRLYTQYKVSNCHFFLIDTRSHRDVPDFENSDRIDKSMLGAEQLEWLTKGIAASDAEFIFVVSSVNFMVPHTEPKAAPGAVPKKGEAWTVFLHERELLLDTWDKLDKPIFLLTGDLHNSFAIQISDNIWEFASGPHESYNHHIGSEGHRPLNGPFQYGPRACDILWSSYLLADTPKDMRRKSHFCVVKVNNIVNNPKEAGIDRWVAFPRPQVVFQYYNGNTGELVFAQTIQAL